MYNHEDVKIKFVKCNLCYKLFTETSDDGKEIENVGVCLKDNYIIADDDTIYLDEAGVVKEK